MPFENTLPGMNEYESRSAITVCESESVRDGREGKRRHREGQRKDAALEGERVMRDRRDAAYCCRPLLHGLRS